MRVRSLVGIVTAGFVVAACVGNADSSDDDTTMASAPGTAEPATDETGGSEPTEAPGSDPASPTPSAITGLELEQCGDFECGTVEVPIDRRQPELGTTEIAINVRRAEDPDRRVGYLLVNPGGPGASGKEFVESLPFFWSGDLLEVFDVVGFDPRGVGESPPPLDCGSQDEFDELTDRVDGEVDSPGEIEAMEGVVQLCADATGPTASYLGTQFVADDMDAIREALGADQISFYGASYGSTIGVWYASSYPDRVRAMVVDGADNPVDELATPEQRLESGLEEIGAFEELLMRALVSCDSAACPIYNDGDPVGYYLDAMNKIGLVDEARPNLVDAGYLGVISTLYDEASWPALHQGVFDLQENSDPELLAIISDFQATGSAITAPAWINCLDQWSLFPELDREVQLSDAAANADVFDEKFPLLAAASIVDDNTNVCPFLDLIVPEPYHRALDGAGVPILVVGNPSDPATPFTESVELADDTLANGYLLEADDAAHVVYGRGNGCVDDLVESTLIDAELPPERRVVCERVDG